MHLIRQSGGRSLRTVQFGVPWFWHDSAYLHIIVGESGHLPNNERVRYEGSSRASIVLGDGQSAYVAFCMGQSRIGPWHEVSLRRGHVFYEDKEVRPVIGRRSLIDFVPTIIPEWGTKKEVVG